MDRELLSAEKEVVSVERQHKYNHLNYSNNKSPSKINDEIAYEFIDQHRPNLLSKIDE